MYFSCSFFFLCLLPLYCPSPAQINVKNIVEVTECPCYIVHTECWNFTALKGSGTISSPSSKDLCFVLSVVSTPIAGGGLRVGDHGS